ncbi:MAG: fumarylacetoacetate hydrolase family protein [Deltaproteobacteria bacterium]|nr:fumarylacetoacetate hydrolase family protein [Deltaproteobacteria bacterium]
MKFVTFLNMENEKRAGIVIDGKVVDLALAGRELCCDLPSTMIGFIKDLPESLEVARKIEDAVRSERVQPVKDQRDIKILAPIPNPPSCRDAYAFRQHVQTARRNRGVDMIPEFDQFPIFYFTNHNAVFGQGDILVEDDHLQRLDFELEVAIVIGKKGRNIPASKADEYIFAYTIMNDLSARQLQMEEMKLNLGPAKGKDFATVIGPWLVTPDELEAHRLSTPHGHKYDLVMKAFHNNEQISEGNVKDMNWTFAEIIERASYGVDLYPGDVIGSGTVGTGCYLELNGTHALQAKEKGENFEPVWLKNGDTITLEIEGLGKLSNRIVRTENEYSILAKKKNV